MPTELESLKSALIKHSDGTYARTAARFFKTGKGHYGEGDVFIGVKVPVLRKITAACNTLSAGDILSLLNSEIHEERLAAALILVRYYEKNIFPRKTVFRFYVKHAHLFNNWDLVDLSAPRIAGTYLLDRDYSPLRGLAHSKNLWRRRIAIVSTYTFIKNGKTAPVYEIAGILMSDQHDLIHKACGWMLREAGKINFREELNYLKKNYGNMPRTMLRYSMEKFPDELRRKFLKGDI
jgi:3-methyladenine DNA glycosylase AlkD